METSCFGVKRLYRILTLHQKVFCLERIFISFLMFLVEKERGLNQDEKWDANEIRYTSKIVVCDIDLYLLSKLTKLHALNRDATFHVKITYSRSPSCCGRAEQFTLVCNAAHHGGVRGAADRTQMPFSWASAGRPDSSMYLHRFQLDPLRCRV